MKVDFNKRVFGATENFRPSLYKRWKRKTNMEAEKNAIKSLPKWVMKEKYNLCLSRVA